MKHICIIIVVLVVLRTTSQAQLVLSQTEDSPKPQSRHSLTTLTAHNVVTQRTNVSYTAVESIMLQPGFTARAGSTFSATIRAYPVETGESLINQLTVKAYPNPFRQETRVEYTLPHSGEVQGVLTNLEGHVLRQSMGTERQERGSHYIDLSVSDLPAGTYIYQVRTNNEQKSIRLIKQSL